MSRYLEKDLEELIDAGVIPTETAERIRKHYQQRKAPSSGRLMVVFGILGALLVGLGVILIIAHNWDDLSRGLKLFFALLPLLIGQVACAYARFKKSDSRAWIESASVFLFFAVGASISIVSQVYNIPGDFGEFMLTWMLTSFLIVLIMRSGATSLLFIIGITVYAYTEIFGYPQKISWYYWLLLALVLPYIVRLLKNGPRNFAVVHRWLLCISLVSTMQMFDGPDNEYIWIIYMSLFGALILIGDMKGLRNEPVRNNAFLVFGSVGSVIALLTATFRDAWDQIARASHLMTEEFYAALVITAMASALLIYAIRERGTQSIHSNAWLFVVFIPLFAIGSLLPGLIQWVMNALVLGIAALTTIRGADRNSMFLLNYGLVIMAALIVCRFFDTDMSFVVRGVLFVLVGLSFFGVNYWFLKKRNVQNV